MKYVIYLRVSTEEQSKGQSMDTQLDICKQAIPENTEYVVISDASSGGRCYEKRERLQEAINALERGDVLLVYKLDRLSRDFDVMGYINTLVKMRKATIISVLEKDVDRAMRGFKTLVADMERVAIRERIKNALHYKKRAGQRIGTIPYGFRVRESQKTIDDNGKIIVERYKKLEINPQEKEIFQTMIDLKNNGKTYREIATYLNDREIYNRRQKPWSHVSIFKLIASIENKETQDTYICNV